MKKVFHKKGTKKNPKRRNKSGKRWRLQIIEENLSLIKKDGSSRRPTRRRVIIHDENNRRLLS